MPQVTPITQPTLLNLLNVAIEKGRNDAIIHLGTDPGRAHAAIIEDAKTFEPVLTAYAVKVKAINNDRDLSDEGKQKRLDRAMGEVTTQLAKLDETTSLEEGCKNAEAVVFNTVKKEMDKHLPQDSTLDYYQQQEVRAFLIRNREEARQAHEAMLTQAEREGRPLADQMKAFYDPTEGLFLQACQEYGKDTALLHRAIVDAPWPISILPSESLQKGRKILEKRLAPDQSNTSPRQEQERTCSNNCLKP